MVIQPSIIKTYLVVVVVCVNIKDFSFDLVTSMKSLMKVIQKVTHFPVISDVDDVKNIIDKMGSVIKITCDMKETFCGLMWADIEDAFFMKDMNLQINPN